MVQITIVKVLLQKQIKLEFDFLPEHNYTKHYIFLDEVGRGCLAGPVVVGGVLWQPNHNYNFKEVPKSWRELRSIGVLDSKKVSESRRENILKELNLNPLKNLSDYLTIDSDQFYFDVDQMEVTQIEQFNILSATMRLMGRVAQKLALKANVKENELITIILDGKEFVTWTHSTHHKFQELPIPKSDSLFAPCSLASIYAKVYRDYQMSFWDLLYPGYEFEKHKGYGTAKHLQCIKSYGVSPIHRKTFAGVKEYISL